jgi:mRNA interferase RelE/StbE
MTGCPWRVSVTGPARRRLDRLPEKVVRAAIEAIEAIAENPYRLGKPLHGPFDGLWVARRGPYRITFAIDPERRTLAIVSIAHRADAYRPR